jgi:hypothetical protein
VKRPAFQFYPADWRKDMALQSCSVAARGLWVDMLCIAHECEPYGHLTVNGKPMTAAQIGRHTGLTQRECEKLLQELADAGVSSTTEEGVIYSRRMVRDEDLRNRRAEGGSLGSEHGIKGKEFGKLGGNPKKKAEYNEPGKLYAVQRTSGGPIKVGITKYLSQRMNGLRKQVGEELRILGSFDVSDMGACEAAVHAEFKGRIEGEWISAEWGEVERVIRGATHPPSQPPPSSSSSSSSSEKTETLVEPASADPTPAPAPPLKAKDLIAEGVEPQKAADWLALRKAKRLPLTPTAWDDTKAEGIKAGLTPPQTVAKAVANNWAGFKAAWLTREVSGKPTAGADIYGEVH